MNNRIKGLIKIALASGLNQTEIIEKLSSLGVSKIEIKAACDTLIAYSNLNRDRFSRECLAALELAIQVADKQPSKLQDQMIDSAICVLGDDADDCP
jgi:hypothetical protein